MTFVIMILQKPHWNAGMKNSFLAKWYMRYLMVRIQ